MSQRRKRTKRTERHIDWEAEPWASFAYHKNTGGFNFKVMRQNLGLTQTRCAEFLDVHRHTVQSWELGKLPVSRMAYYLLLLLSESRHFTITHTDWNGWHVARDGKLYGPDEKYGFTAASLRAFWIEGQIARTAKRDAVELRERLNAATAENTQLRSLFVNQGVIDELGSMQERLSALMAQLNTAKVIPFPEKHKSSEAAA